MKEVSWTSRLLWNVPGESWAHGSSCLLTPFSLETGHPGPGASSSPRTFLLRPPDTAVLQRPRPRLAPSECVLLSGSHRRSKGAQATLRGRWGNAEASARNPVRSATAGPGPFPSAFLRQAQRAHCAPGLGLRGPTCGQGCCLAGL